MLKEKEQQIKTQITSLDTRDALIQYLKKNKLQYRNDADNDTMEHQKV